MEEIQIFLNNHFECDKYIVSLEELYMLFEKNSISTKDRKDILKQVYQYNKKI